ncbi:hypothetical protein AJ79_01675 [Helicocarpus griseus UAMH5409]|uniref:Uncharacterized protein n=1 Tax=Helicocarpus griseus UAMH5409 TaxID=1447875 RepID=A0A2B7Y637_9EURO|nr:hypothetical protein AJ79_01675 [Helicocarpus griseus UAMH5409]
MLPAQALRRPAILTFIVLAFLLCLVSLSRSLDSHPLRVTPASPPVIPDQEQQLSNPKPQTPGRPQPGTAQSDNGEELVKPTTVNITGMVFFGRRDRVEAMNCYVERNLIENGGWLDEVLWYANTNNEEDLKFLDKIVERSPRYKKITLEKPVGWPDYTKLWRRVERGTVYVKIDDDILWLADDAIPRMVLTKLKYPDSFAVSANVINSPPLSFLHFHLGALHPYFPEREHDPTRKNHSENENWRPSSHPFWEGTSTFEWPLDKEPPSYTKHHRWLRVREDKQLYRTPAAKLTYDFWGPTYESWAIAAQQHYSLLENLEKGTTDLYKFSPPWNMQGERIRINLLAILGDDVLDTDVEHWPDDRGDEDMIVLDLPKQLQRHILIEGNALAAHYNFYHQGGLTSTDLLERYTMYAKENVCPVQPAQGQQQGQQQGQPQNQQQQQQ